jgi:hypothetical protein
MHQGFCFRVGHELQAWRRHAAMFSRGQLQALCGFALKVTWGVGVFLHAG